MRSTRVSVLLCVIAGIVVSAATGAEAAPTAIDLACPTPTITEPGSYVATGSGPADCDAPTIIEITASNVTLDLNGHTIDGDDDPARTASPLPAP